MRTLIVNAVLVDGSGAAPRTPVSVVVEDHLIEEVIETYAPYYDTAEVVIDARGGFLLPGVINHHVHGLTRGPLMIGGEPPLSDARVRANLDRLLGQGVTTALNVDGFATVEDAVAQTRWHPVTVKVATLHTPTHFKWAVDGPFPFGGVKPRHKWTLDQMLERGAPAIGEAGPGCDAHWADYSLIPQAVAERGGRATAVQAREIRLAAEKADRRRVAELLPGVGLNGSQVDELLDVHEATVIWRGLAQQALQEAVDAARERAVPMVLHHTPGTYEIVLDAVRGANAPIIAGHSNFQIHDADDAARRARTIREAGGVIDIMSCDSWSAGVFQPTPEVTHRLLADGLVDLVSTDYAGGFWDPMLLMLERAHEAGAVELGPAVRMVTGAVADVLPRLAPDRGYVREGAVADLIITEPGRLSAVREVLVAGRVVERGRALW